MSSDEEEECDINFLKELESLRDDQQFQELVSFAERTKTVLLWSYSEAPEYIRFLCSQGGDEDFVAFVPRALPDWYSTIFHSSAFGIIHYRTRIGVFHVATHS